ncbi:hypothetical protein AB0I28_36060 [Phytomonospora sp. NPDC050363]|uniref:hypothetical protein n=1 Tax=Phytomonospora sp. NPDC050363 TaxID=3155642 RepID=UPI0033EF78A6
MERPTKRGGPRLTAALALTWALLAAGVPFLMLSSALEGFSFMPSGRSVAEAAAVEAASRLWMLWAFGLAVTLPLAGLALSLFGRRRAQATVFAVLGGLVLLGSLVPLTGTPGNSNTVVEWVFHGDEPYTPPPAPPAGCFGDSPTDEGNPACRGG